MRIAFFGGSFNPPHYSHVFAMSWALCSGEVEQVWMVPCQAHALGKSLLPFHHRVEMCRLLVKPLFPHVQISTVEHELPTPNYTVQTLEHLTQSFPEHSFRLLVGADILLEKHLWKDFARVEQLAPLLLIGRQGTPPTSDASALASSSSAASHRAESALTLELPAISSSFIRQALHQGGDVSAWVPESVRSYIRDQRLFAATAE